MAGASKKRSQTERNGHSGNAGGSEHHRESQRAASSRAGSSHHTGSNGQRTTPNSGSRSSPHSIRARGDMNVGSRPNSPRPSSPRPAESGGRSAAPKGNYKNVDLPVAAHALANIVSHVLLVLVYRFLPEAGFVRDIRADKGPCFVRNGPFLFFDHGLLCAKSSSFVQN